MLTHEQAQTAARRAHSTARSSKAVPTPKTGDEIFEGTPYPKGWENIVGQQQAKEELMAACYSARVRQTRLDHILIASGHHGVGKTVLAKNVALDIGTGIVEVQGVLTEEDFIAILRGMSDNDVLFWGEFHRAVSGGKMKAEFLLAYLQDGLVMTKHGPVVLPLITLIADTTDAQRLPETILSRFKIRPVIVAYSELEGAQLASRMARRHLEGMPEPSLETCLEIARAANCNPREIDTLLVRLRDAAICRFARYDSNGKYEIDKALQWAGVTADGLSKLAQDYLVVLLATFDGRAGETTIAKALGEPTPPRHTEKLLLQKGLLSITPSGRELTELGVDRTLRLLDERGLIEEEKA